MAPVPGKPLRDLVDAGLDLSGVVVWLDDLERFLKGDDALDPALFEELVAGGAMVVGTIRRKELSRFRPTDESRAPTVDVLRRFRTIELPRRLSPDELARVRERVDDAAVLAGVDRFGLAEYLGAAPDALGKFTDGETTCPVGHALVRAAVDWRRAGLARPISRDVLIQALPIYLEDRPEVDRSPNAIDAGLTWTMEKINETVALLGVQRLDDVSGEWVFEAFDYLIDSADLSETPVPARMWRLVVSAASRAEATDVEHSRSFIGRLDAMAELLAWIAGPDSAQRRLLILTGGAGVGKSALLGRLADLTASASRRAVGREHVGPATRLGSVDAVVNASRRTAYEVIADIARAFALYQHPELSLDESMVQLIDAIVSTSRRSTVVVDSVDDAVEPVCVARCLARLANHHVGVIAGTRKLPDVLEALGGGRVIDLDADEHKREDVAALVHHVLMTRARSAYRDPQTAERVAEEVADQADGNFLFARIMAEELADRGRIATPGGEHALLSPPLSDTLRERLAAAGVDRPRAEPLLAALAFAGSELSVDAWLRAAGELGDGDFTRGDVERLLASPVAAFVAVGGDNQPTYRIAHVRIAQFVTEIWRERRSRDHPPR